MTAVGVPAAELDDGLVRAGIRPSLRVYTRELIARRRFILTLSLAKSSVGYATNTLGQVWQLLNPLLQVGVYYLIFGVLLHTTRGVHDFISFLTLGLAFFGLTTSSLKYGSRAVLDATGLIQALHFPRAVLPICSVLVALHRMVFALVVGIVVLLLTGERPKLRWLLVFPALTLQILFCFGLAFVAARLAASITDLPQLLPYAVRIWLYVSGVLYSVDRFTQHHSQWFRAVLKYNPGRVFVDLPRHALLDGTPLYQGEWLVGAGWSIAALAIGYVTFWSAEERYGRV